MMQKQDPGRKKKQICHPNQPVQDPTYSWPVTSVRQPVAMVVCFGSFLCIRKGQELLNGLTSMTWFCGLRTLRTPWLIIDLVHPDTNTGPTQAR